MKTNKWLCAIALCAMTAVSLSSCKGDEPDPNDPKPDNNKGLKDPSVENYDPSRSTEKQYLEDTALEFGNYFDARDQQSLLEMASYYSEVLADYEFPETFSEPDNGRSLMRAIATGDYYGISRSVYTYTYDMARFQGIYEPDRRTRKWVYSGKSDDFVMKFTDDFQKPCVITVSGSKDTWKYEKIIDGDYVIMDVPKTMNLTMSRDNVDLVKATVKTEFQDRVALNITVDAVLMNVQIKSTTKGTPTEVKESFDLGVNYTRLVSAQAVITGTDLLSVETWENTMDRFDENDAIARMISGAKASASVLRRVNVDAEITSIRNFLDYVDFYAYSWNGERNAEREAKEAADKLSAAMSAYMTYAGSNTRIAALGWEPYCVYFDDYYYNEEEWSVRPNLRFESDGAVYDFESYFGNDNFFKVENLWESIIKKYEKYFD